jgi:hypothetical protein
MPTTRWLRETSGRDARDRREYQRAVTAVNA